MVIYTLNGIFILITILLIIATVMCMVLKSPIIVLTIPGVLITLFILSTCIACPTPPTQSHGYIDAKAGSYGYLDTGDITYIIPPGKSLFKWPWQKFIEYPYEYRHHTIKVPTATRDGMRLYYTYEYLHIRFDPYQFHYMYQHNWSNFDNHFINAVKPTIDAYMSTIGEDAVETRGGSVIDEIDRRISSLTPQDGFTYDPTWTTGKYISYFMHIDNPQMSYACTGAGSGYCAYGDSLGLPSASNRYVPGMSIPPRQVSNDESSIVVEPTPTYTYIDDSNAPSTQAEVDAMIDACLNDPQCAE